MFVIKEEKSRRKVEPDNQKKETSGLDGTRRTASKGVGITFAGVCHPQTPESVMSMLQILCRGGAGKMVLGAWNKSIV